MFQYSVASVTDMQTLFRKRLAERNYDIDYKKCLEQYFNDYISGRSIILVIKDGDNPIGSINLEFCDLVGVTDYIPRGSKYCYLSTFKIEKKYAGQGHISKLCKLVESLARNLGYGYAVIACDETNIKAKNIYEHWGYKEIALKKESNSYTVIYLVKYLNCDIIHANIKPYVSIVVPIYNTGEILKSTLDCIVHQTYTNFELILVDDDSDYVTKNILKDAKLSDRRIKIIYQSHSGAGVARNTGLNNAIGKYVLFLDSDDLFMPNMIDILVKTADVNKSDVVTFNFSSFNECPHKATPVKCLYEDLEPRNYSAYELRNDIFQRTLATACNKFFNRRFLIKTKTQFQNLPFFNDEYFSRMAILQSNRTYYIKDNLMFYRLDSMNNIHHNKDGSILFSVVVYSIYDSLKKLNKLNDYQESFYVYLMDVIDRALRHSHNKTNFKLVFEECKELLIKCNMNVSVASFTDHRSQVIKAVFDNDVETCYSLFKMQ